MDQDEGLSIKVMVSQKFVLFLKMYEAMRRSMLKDLNGKMIDKGVPRLVTVAFALCGPPCELSARFTIHSLQQARPFSWL